MHYLFGVLWMVGAGVQLGLALTSDDRFTTVFALALAGFSIGMSAYNFVKAAQNA
jgi:hypothetical protein